MVVKKNRYVLYLHMDMPPLNANQRWGHWAERARVVAEVREKAGFVIRAARMGRVKRVRVQLVWRPGVKRDRDPANIWPTQKAVIDGMVDAGVVPDDNERYVEEMVPKLLPVEDGQPEGVWFVVEVLAR